MTEMEQFLWIKVYTACLKDNTKIDGFMIAREAATYAVGDFRESLVEIEE